MLSQLACVRPEPAQQLDVESHSGCEPAVQSKPSLAPMVPIRAGLFSVAYADPAIAFFSATKEQRDTAVAEAGNAVAELAESDVVALAALTLWPEGTMFRWIASRLANLRTKWDAKYWSAVRKYAIDLAHRSSPGSPEYRLAWTALGDAAFIRAVDPGYAAKLVKVIYGTSGKVDPTLLGKFATIVERRGLSFRRFAGDLKRSEPLIKLEASGQGELHVGFLNGRVYEIYQVQRGEDTALLVEELDFFAGFHGHRYMQ